MSALAAKFKECDSTCVQALTFLLALASTFLIRPLLTMPNGGTLLLRYP